MANSLNEPTLDDLRRQYYSLEMRQRGTLVELEAERKWAICLLKLAPAVNQPGDYATLATAIKAVSGVQDIDLIIDGQATDDIPEGYKLVMASGVNQRFDEIPE